MSTYTVYQKAFYADTKNYSVLLKAEFVINGTNSLRAGRRPVSYFLCCTRKSKAAFTLGARTRYPSTVLAGY